MVVVSNELVADGELLLFVERPAEVHSEIVSPVAIHADGLNGGDTCLLVEGQCIGRGIVCLMIAHSYAKVQLLCPSEGFAGIHIVVMDVLQFWVAEYDAQRIAVVAIAHHCRQVGHFRIYFCRQLPVFFSSEPQVWLEEPFFAGNVMASHSVVVEMCVCEAQWQVDEHFGTDEL